MCEVWWSFDLTVCVNRNCFWSDIKMVYIPLGSVCLSMSFQNYSKIKVNCKFTDPSACFQLPLIFSFSKTWNNLTLNSCWHELKRLKENCVFGDNSYQQQDVAPVALRQLANSRAVQHKEASKSPSYTPRRSLQRTNHLTTIKSDHNA